MIYASLVWEDYGYTSPMTCEGGEERTIIIGGWSKGWAMTGWRMGIGGNKEVIDAVKKVNASAATHIPTFNARWNYSTIAEKKLKMKIPSKIGVMSSTNCLTELRDNSAKTEGAFYALCDVSGTGMDDIEFATRAKEAKYNLSQVLMEGGEGFVRILRHR